MSIPKTYAITRSTTGVLGFQCRRCNLTSHNQHDIRHRYCSKCRLFHDGLVQEFSVKIATDEQLDEALSILSRELSRRF